MDILKVTIETERLLLVPISLEYADDIFKEFTPEITRFMYPKSPDKIEETIEYIQDRTEKMKRGEEIVISILDKNTKELIGGSGLHHLSTKVLEFGIWIKRGAHGNKYGREAIAGVKKWAEENLDFDYFIYPADRNNIPSRKIAESLGGKIHKEYRQKSLSGVILDEVEYRIEKAGRRVVKKT